MKLSPFIVASVIWATMPNSSQAIEKAIEKFCRNTEILLNLETPPPNAHTIKSCITNTNGGAFLYVDNLWRIPSSIRANRARIEKYLHTLDATWDIWEWELIWWVWRYRLWKDNSYSALGIDTWETLMARHPQMVPTPPAASVTAQPSTPASAATIEKTPKVSSVQSTHWEIWKHIGELNVLQGKEEKKLWFMNQNTLLWWAGLLWTLWLGIYFWGKGWKMRRNIWKRGINWFFTQNERNGWNTFITSSQNPIGIATPAPKNQLPKRETGNVWNTKKQTTIFHNLKDIPVLKDHYSPPKKWETWNRTSNIDTNKSGLDIDLDILDKIFQWKVDFLFEGIEPNYALIDYILKDPKNWDCMIPLYKAYKKIKPKLPLYSQAILDKKFLRNLWRDAMKLIDNPETFLSTVSDDLQTEIATIHSTDRL